MKKVCTRCEKEKELKEFAKARKGKFGRRSICKACTKIYQTENKERIAAKARTWYGGLCQAEFTHD